MHFPIVHHYYNKVLYSYNSYIYYTPLLSQYIICISPITQLSQQNVIYTGVMY